jgi:hypothetical protein
MEAGNQIMILNRKGIERKAGVPTACPKGNIGGSSARPVVSVAAAKIHPESAATLPGISTAVSKSGAM